MKKISVIIFLLGAIFLSETFCGMVHAEDNSSQTDGSGEQESDTPPVTDPGNSEGGDSPGDNTDPNPNPDHGVNDNSVDDFGGNGASQPSHGATIDTIRPTIKDETKETINNPFLTGLGLEHTSRNEDSANEMEDSDVSTELEVSGDESKRNFDDVKSKESITTPVLRSDYENRNLTLLIVSVLTSLGVVSLAIFAGIVTNCSRNQSDRHLATK